MVKFDRNFFSRESPKMSAGFALPRGGRALGLTLAIALLAAPVCAQKRNTAVRWNEQALSGSGDFKIFKFETFSGPSPFCHRIYSSLHLSMLSHVTHIFRLNNLPLFHVICGQSSSCW